MSLRILHSADWHLGRVFQQIPLIADQEAAVEDVVRIIVEERPNVVALAGDIFDRTNPRREAVELFDHFLGRVYRETESAIVVISGNHDAPERIAYGGALHDPMRACVRGPVIRDEDPFLVETDGVRYAISPIPYAGVFEARAAFDAPEIATTGDVVARQVKAARARVPEGMPWIVIAHTFAAGGSVSESERRLDIVGGTEVVSTHVFDGASYVALGHLHRPQTVSRSPFVRYSGSMMPYGFDEVSAQKSVSIVDVEADGSVSVRERPVATPRTLRVLSGSFGEFTSGESGVRSDDIVKFVLSDTVVRPDALGRLRERYPNAVAVEWAKVVRSGPGGREAIDHRALTPAKVIASFFDDRSGRSLDENETALVEDILRTIQAREDG